MEVLEAIGLTAEELRNRVIDSLCDRLLSDFGTDEDGNAFTMNSPLARKLQGIVMARIDGAIAALAEKHVLPNVAAYIETLALQETNRWGEKTGKAITFIEYLVRRAEAYMVEPVDMYGRAKGDDRFSSQSQPQTRITFLVHEHLHYSIETAMKDALATANSQIVAGLQETAKMKLAEIAKALKVEVKTR